MQKVTLCARWSAVLPPASESRRLAPTPVAGDIGDAASLRAAIEGCTHVVHLVALIKGRPAEFQAVMTDGTRSLVAAARDAGVERFVLMSALGAAEPTPQTVPYFRAKWAMEQEVKGSGLEHTIFRPSFVFGKGGALATFVAQVRYSPLVTVIGDGRQRSQPIWVDDVAAYVAKAIDQPARGKPHVRARRPGHRRLGRALPADREGHGQASAPRPCPVRPRRSRREP